MSNVLVAYGSKHGATEEIAEAIADELRSAGHSVDCVSAERVTGLGSYDAAVIGSAVYMARWRPGARRLLKRAATELTGRPLWLFSSGPCGQAEPSWASPPGIEKRAKRLGAAEHAVFGGRVPLEPANFIERSIAKKSAPEHRDLRDWDRIRGWAAAMASELPGSGDPVATP
jgi:menaquinone-dependent protoporphyrinogen oxidase